MAGRRHATIATTSNWIAALLLLAATATGAKETPPEVRVVSSASLRNDAALLRQTYEALHPDLYRYNRTRRWPAASRTLTVLSITISRRSRPSWPSCVLPRRSVAGTAIPTFTTSPAQSSRR